MISSQNQEVSVIQQILQLAENSPTGKKLLEQGKDPILDRKDVSNKLKDEISEFESAVFLWQKGDDEFVEVLGELADIAYYTVLEIYIYTKDIATVHSKIANDVEPYAARVGFSCSDALNLAVRKYEARQKYGKNSKEEKKAILNYLKDKLAGTGNM